MSAERVFHRPPPASPSTASPDTGSRGEAPTGPKPKPSTQSQDSGDSTWRRLVPSRRAGLAVRVARAEDATTIAKIAVDAYVRAHQQLFPPFKLIAQARERFDESRLRDVMGKPASCFLLSTWAGHPTGFTQLQATPAPLDRHRGISTQIVGLYVKPDWIGNGIGSDLVRGSMQVARHQSCGSIWADVPEMSDSGQSFLKRHGFREIRQEARIVSQEILWFVTLYRRLTQPTPPASRVSNQLL